MGHRWRLFRSAERRRGLPTAAALVLVYCSLALAVESACQDSARECALWPAVAVIVAGFLTLPRREAFVFVAVCLGFNFIIDRFFGIDLPHDIFYCLLNAALIFSVSFLTRSLCGAAIDLSRIRRLCTFGVIAVVCATLETIVGEFARRFIEPPSAIVPSEWLQWVGEDALGLLIATPAVLLPLKRDWALYASSSGPL